MTDLDCGFVCLHLRFFIQLAKSNFKVAKKGIRDQVSYYAEELRGQDGSGNLKKNKATRYYRRYRLIDLMITGRFSARASASKKHVNADYVMMSISRGHWRRIIQMVASMMMTQMGQGRQASFNGME